MMTRECTREERAKLDKAWNEYLNAHEDIDAVVYAWEAYQRVMESMNVFPTLTGYRVRIMEAKT